MSDRQTLAPDAAMLERLADEAVARLPEGFRRFLDGVVVRIDEFPDEQMLRELGMEDPFEMTSGELPAVIHLFRRPLLDEWCETGVALEDLITHVIVHEVGHHFGFSDEDMHAIESLAG